MAIHFNLLTFRQNMWNLFGKHSMLTKVASCFCKRNDRFLSGVCDAEKQTDHKFVEINFEQITSLIPISESNCTLPKVVEEMKQVVAKGWRHPKLISSNQLQKLFNLQSRSQRTEYLVYLFKKEKLKLADQMKKELRRIELNSKVTDSKDKCPTKSSLFLHVRKRSILKFHNKKWALSTLFGQKIVLDLGYADYMTEKELTASVSQLLLIYSFNRQNVNPYDLYYCNAFSKSENVKLFIEMPNVNDSLLNISEKSYKDIFPKEKLVYLSPHAEEKLKEYDHSAVYIIGAFVDTVKKQKISFAKARTDGIKSYSLPLDEYVMWGSGTKSLTINQVFEIMSILKNTGDWKKAFAVVPSRKLRKLEPSEIEESDLPTKIFVMSSNNK